MLISSSCLADIHHYTYKIPWNQLFVGQSFIAQMTVSAGMTFAFGNGHAILRYCAGGGGHDAYSNVLVDGFGVIAMVAMAPVLSIMILGAVIKRKTAPLPRTVQYPSSLLATNGGIVDEYDCVVAIVNRGLADRAVELAREMGAKSATIIHGRGSGGHDVKVFHIELRREKEAIFWLCDVRISESVARTVYSELDLGGDGSGTVFIMPASAMGLDIQPFEEADLKT